MESREVRRSALLVIGLALGLVLGALLVTTSKLADFFGGGPDPETVATASLQSVREQARLVPFAARFVAVVTSTQSRLGLEARKTLIMPGMVRYEIDLARLRQRDLAWDAEGKALTITLPALEISAPEIDLNALQEYSGNGMVMALTGAENRLDASNRQRGQSELLRQARDPVPMRLARDAAKRAVERSFAMPLKAAGVDATVAVRFADEAGSRDPSQMDRSRRIEDVLKERQP